MHRDWEAEAWVGTAERLIRIQGLIQDALARAYTDAVTALPAMDKHSREREIDSLGRELGLTVKVVGSKGRLIRSGELSAIVAEMDPAEIEAVVMGVNVNGPSDALPGLLLRFERNPVRSWNPPLEFSVSGPDRHWVGGLNDSLQTELRRGVPWWSVLRRPSAAAVLTLVPILGVVFGLAFGSDLTGTEVLTLVVLGVILLPLLVMILTVPLHAVLKRLFPGFEVLEPGAVARGRQVLAAAVTTVSFAVGVIGLIVSL